MDDELFILALDHRGSIERLHDVTPPVEEAQRRAITASKQLVFEALATAAERLDDPASAGVLVDEQYGTPLLEHVRGTDVRLAVCVERSGQDVVTFEHADWQLHVDRVAPDLVKVLARYHPDGDAVANALQRERLRALGAFLATRPDTGYLLELLVPPNDVDLAGVDGDRDRFVAERRADLVVAAIDQMHDADVEPDVWKVEGLPATADCQRVADACRTEGRDDVGVVVLGAGASVATVRTWVAAAAPVDGYRGFAVGRTIWADELRAHLADELPAEELRERVADTYLTLVDTYREAAG